MKKHSHVIGQQVFEVSFSSESRGHELQNKISSLFNRNLQEDMGRLFDRMIPEQKMLRVDNLTINIGNIPFEALDDEFVDKIIENLEREISLLLLHDNSAKDGQEYHEPGDRAASYSGLLEYFLLKGALPWWAGSESGISPLMAFELLLKDSPEALIKLIMRIGQSSNVRRRLIYQFSELQVKALIKVMEPTEAEFIFDYHSEIIKVQQQKQLIKNEESEFKKAVWEFIITYLIVDRGSHFNRKEFVKSTLLGIATNFNVSFDGLLNLFAASLVPGSPYLTNVDSLQTIIFEIAVEHGTRIKLNTPLDEILERAIETPDRGVDLLRYYLTFGSFPWWSMNVTGQELEVLVANMIRKYPRTIESLVKSVGREQYSRKLMVKTFREEMLHDLLIIIEPENAEFIIDYIGEIKATHTRKAIFKSQTEDVHQAVWEFVLEYLLVDHGSEFNRQVFLDSNLKQLANRFNLNYQDLLVFMVNNIAVAHQNSTRHLSLFRDLTSLYDNRKKSEVREDLRIETGEVISDVMISGKGAQKTIRNVNLLNVLYYWVKTGHKPWWAGNYLNVSPSVMINQLLTESPLEALIFIKHAGLQVKMRKRLVFQVPFETLLRLFQLFPSGSDIVQYSRGLLVLIRSSKTVKYSDPSVTERILLFSLWETLIDVSYRGIKPLDFIKTAIVKHASWFQIPFSRLVASLRIDDKSDLSALVKEASKGHAVPAKVYDDGLMDEWSDNHSIEQILSGVLVKRGEAEVKLSQESVLAEALSILQFFLQHNKLPEEFKIFSHSSVNSFLKQLLLIVHKGNSAELKKIMNSAENKGENFLRIHEIFSTSNSIAESAVSNMLKSTLEKDILLFIRQHGKLEDSSKSMLSFIDDYISAPDNLQRIEFLRQLLRYSSFSMQVAYYYKNETAYKLINNNFIQIGWGNQTTSFLKSFNDWALSKVQDSLDRERLDLLFRTFNFIMIGGELRVGSLQSYLKYLFEYLFERDYQLMLKLASVLTAADSSGTDLGDPVISGSITEIKMELDPYTKFTEMSSELSARLKDADELAMKKIYADLDDQREKEKKLLLEEQKESRSEEDQKKTIDNLDEPEKIYIKNAGLVILHPFLSTYFNRLQMLDKGDFINEDMRHRAVHLLQYLAFGTEINEEHELVLNKILCNIPVDEPILPGIELSEQERTISAELLNAVIVQWDKLKNSSAESFQASFLQRDGGLYKVEDNWNLKVEERGYDVLLSTLPWGLGMIKTSWMTDFIYVEWM